MPQVTFTTGFRFIVVSETLEQLELLVRGSVDLIERQEFSKRLASHQPLRIKVGFDPTAPDLHLGHAVLFTKMRQFQDLGHQVIFLVGDFTATIGDPSGRVATRPQIESPAIKTNANTYTEQVFKILDRERTELRYNSEWMDQMSAAGLVKLAQNYTVARMLERRDFNSRYQQQQPIAIHEFLYPLVQGYDSVMLKCDVELGGTDQLFNLTVGRVLQKHYGQTPQCVLTTPLLLGLRGEEKMSKTANNYVGLAEDANTIYAKIMSISDERMWHYYDLLSLLDTAQLSKLRREIASGANPRDAKDTLAFELTQRLHDTAQAEAARRQFAATFQRHEFPADPEQITLPAPPQATASLSTVLKQAGLVTSLSSCRRLIAQNGIRVDGHRINTDIPCYSGKQYLVQVGKRRFAKIKLS